MDDKNVSFGIINPIHLIDKKIYKLFSRNGNVKEIKYDMASFFRRGKLTYMMSIFPELKGRHPDLTEQNELENNILSITRKIESAGIQTLIFSSEFITEILADEINIENAYRRIEIFAQCICQSVSNIGLIAEMHPLSLEENHEKLNSYKRLLDNLEECLIRKSKTKIFTVETAFGEGDCLDEKNIGLDIGIDKRTLSLTDDIASFVLTHISDKESQFDVPCVSNLDMAMRVKSHQKKCSFKLIYQLNPDDYFYGRLVCKERIALGRRLASSIPKSVIDEIDFVSPVPNTGTYYAMGLAEGISKPYIQGIMKTLTEERSFQLADADMRKKFLWSKIKTLPELVEGKTVAVVDEAIFTGSTLKAVCGMLHESKVQRIYLCIPTPRCRYHCSYKVHPDRAMLLEYLTEPMLTDYFDVDGIFFQEDHVFENVLDSIENDLCRECFMGGDGIHNG
ncbi:MAG: hypothetical protein NC124_11070 [Clostridium sp.]|nr:hypothetical protein [Clostridium sp.]